MTDIFSDRCVQFVGDGLRAGAPKEDPAVDSLTSASLSKEGAYQEDPTIGHFRLAYATLDEEPMRAVRLPSSLIR